MQAAKGQGELTSPTIPSPRHHVMQARCSLPRPHSVANKNLYAVIVSNEVFSAPIAQAAQPQIRRPQLLSLRKLRRPAITAIMRTQGYRLVATSNSSLCITT